MIVRYDRFLRSFDTMLGDTLYDIMQQQGVEFVTQCIPVELQKNQNNLTLVCEDNKKITGLNYDPVELAKILCEQIERKYEWLRIEESSSRGILEIRLSWTGWGTRIAGLTV